VDLDILKWFDEEFEYSAGGDVTKTLAGQAIASTLGTISVKVDYTATGLAITSTEGTPTYGVSYTAVGQSITSAEGAITAAWSGSATLGGQAITSSLGTVTATVSYALTGQSIASTEGTITPSLAVALTGIAVTSAEGAIAPEVDYSLTGQVGTFTEGTISASQGGNVTLTLNGQAITSTLGAIAAEIDYALAGQALTSAEGTPGLEVDYAVAGQLATFTEGTITAQAGGDVTIQLAGQSLALQIGSITVSGQDVLAPVTTETPAGRPRRYREIYRVSIDGRKFEFRSLADAIAFLEKAKAAAAKLAAETSRKATDAQRESVKRVPPPRLKVPEIGISSRELRKAAAETKREIEVIYQAAVRDAEIAMLMELNRRAEDDDEALTWLL